MTEMVMKPALLVLAALAFYVPVIAQEGKPEETPAAPTSTKRPPSPAPRHGFTTALRVVVTISRYEGEKKVSSLPYSLELVADHAEAHVRMGVDLPVPVRFAKKSRPTGETPDGDDPSADLPTQYRNVGTNLDCHAEAAGDGRYRLALSVEQSSVSASREGGEIRVSNMPLFRSFKWKGSLLLREGQTVQHVAATDPVTGESVRVDVALSFPK
jgi:hypothetical protein